MNSVLGIVGVGHVGQTVAYTAALRGIARKIILVDCDRQKCESQCYDLNDAMSFYDKTAKICAGSYEDLAECDAIVISIGSEIAQEDRLDELGANVSIIASVVPQIMQSGFQGKLVVVTNPCDIIAYQVMQLSGLPKHQIICSGTALDSARLKTILSLKLAVSPKSISGFMLGEHGESQFVAWSKVEIFGKRIEDFIRDNNLDRIKINPESIETLVRRRGWDIFIGKNSTEFGIGNTVCNILQSIFYDEKSVQVVSAYLEGQYGMSDLFISTPCVIGKDGIEQILELSLDESEMEKYQKSADVIKKHIAML